MFPGPVPSSLGSYKEHSSAWSGNAAIGVQAHAGHVATINRGTPERVPGPGLAPLRELRRRSRSHLATLVAKTHRAIFDVEHID